MKEIIILFLVLVLAIALVVMPGRDGIKKPKDALLNNGYSEVNIKNRSLAGCYDDETVGYAWAATNPNGIPKSGTLCGRADSGNMYWRIVVR